MMKTIEMINARARKPEWSMAEPVNFCLEEGEHIAIVGRNGAGKSMFVDMITGRHPAFPDMVKYGFEEPYNYLKHITFRDTYGGDNDRTYFLQQRWNQMEIDEETPTVGSKLEEAYQLAGEDTPERRQLQRLLKIPNEEMGKFMDATDALAAAYCHYMQMGRPESDVKYRGWKDFVNKNTERVNRHGLTRMTTDKTIRKDPCQSDAKNRSDDEDD